MRHAHTDTRVQVHSRHTANGEGLAHAAAEASGGAAQAATTRHIKCRCTCWLTCQEGRCQCHALGAGMHSVGIWPSGGLGGSHLSYRTSLSPHCLTHTLRHDCSVRPTKKGRRRLCARGGFGPVHTRQKAQCVRHHCATTAHRMHSTATMWQMLAPAAELSRALHGEAQSPGLQPTAGSYGLSAQHAGLSSAHVGRRGIPRATPVAC